MADGLERVRRVMESGQPVDLPQDMQPETGGESTADDWVPDYSPPAPPHPPADAPRGPEADCVEMPLNDYGNGQRMIRHFGEDLKCEPKLGWHQWVGTHYAIDRHQIDVRKRAQQLGALITREIPHIRLEDWQMDLIGTEPDLRARRKEQQQITNEEGKITEAAQGQIDEIDARLASIADLKRTLAGRRKAHFSFARSSGNKGKIDASITEAAPHLSVDFEQLDANPFEVNCLNGLLRFSRGEKNSHGVHCPEIDLFPHDRAHLVTKLIPANFDEYAECPEFFKFLRRIQPDAPIRAFLQRWFGLSMSGLTVQAMTFFYGAGANGKSILVEIIAKVLAEYAADIRIETLTGRNSGAGAAATPDLVYLVGARMARASEPKEGDPLQDGLVKSLTSGEPIMVRPNFGEFFRFYPIFKLTMSGNHKPDIRSTDDGIWRRINLVPFDVQIPEAERIPEAELLATLWAERDGIFKWMVDGFLEYLQYGLQVPDQIRAATAEYREDSDPIGSFIAGCCICTGESTDRISSRDLTHAFNYWIDQRGEGKWTERRVSTRLKEKAGRWKSPADGRGFDKLKSGGLMTYTGIKFNAEFGPRFLNAPRDQEGRPLGGRNAADV